MTPAPSAPSPPAAPPAADLHAAVTGWYAANARELPWRSAEADPWGVLVSEVMLQQTPVNRVLPVWSQWMARWPTPADLAADSAGEAVRAWGRLGYPRRALRLHEAACAIVDRSAGRVPSSVEDLRSLPGVGAYTAAAVASFAFGSRHAVVDTNVRRVHARAVTGVAAPAPALTVAETRLAEALLPPDDAAGRRLSPLWSVAVMELGALVCTARAPRCPACPIASSCRWNRRGRPAASGPGRPGQAWHGTDRQVRGRLLALLRETAGSLPLDALDPACDDAEQRRRCLRSLVDDGLVQATGDERYRLPGGVR